jgi:hypothetical protein
MGEPNDIPLTLLDGNTDETGRPMQKVEILLNCNKDGLPLRSLALRGQFGGQDARQ